MGNQNVIINKKFIPQGKILVSERGCEVAVFFSAFKVPNSNLVSNYAKTVTKFSSFLKEYYPEALSISVHQYVNTKG